MVVNTINVHHADGDPLEWFFKEKEGTKPMTFIQARGVEAKLEVPDKEAFDTVTEVIDTPGQDKVLIQKFEIEGDYFMKVDDRYMNLGIESVKKARKGSKVNACDIIAILHPHNYDMYRYDMSKGIKIRRIINTPYLNGFVAEVPKSLGWDVHLLIRRRDLPNSPEWMGIEISKKKSSTTGVFIRTEYQDKVDLMLNRFRVRAVSKQDLKLDSVDVTSDKISREIKPWRYTRHLEYPPTKFIIYHKSAKTKRRLNRLLKKNENMHNGIRYQLIEYESLSPDEPMKCNSVTLYGILFSKSDEILSKFRYVFVMSKTGRTYPIKES